MTTTKNKFKEYGFERKIFTELNCTGVQGEALKGAKYGYTKEYKANEELTVTLNIIPKNGEWICEREDFNWKLYSKIGDFTEKLDDTETKLFKEFQNFDGSRINFAMMKLGYTNDTYRKVSRWAYMDTKESALEEMIFQYGYMLEAQEV